MIPGDEWKEEVAQEAPTASDIRKYHATKALILLDVPFSFSGPTQITIEAIVNNGDLFKTSASTYREGVWLKRVDVRIIAILPTPPEAPPVQTYSPVTQPNPLPRWRSKLISWLMR